MSDVRRAAEAWLKENGWDYQKYGDKRPDRSAYDTMMKYEVAAQLEMAFEAGAAWQRERDAQAAEQWASARNPDAGGQALRNYAFELRRQTFDDPKEKA